MLLITHRAQDPEMHLTIFRFIWGFILFWFVPHSSECSWELFLLLRVIHTCLYPNSSHKELPSPRAQECRLGQRAWSALKFPLFTKQNPANCTNSPQNVNHTENRGNRLNIGTLHCSLPWPHNPAGFLSISHPGYSLHSGKEITHQWTIIIIRNLGLG